VNLTKTWMAFAISTLVAGSALAAVSADEAKQLGTTLTPIGAEKAANKDGTIPAWSGGLTTPPAGFQKGGTKRADPFAAEKPRLVITGKDMAAHADKLTEGTKELLKRHPTLRVDVYPTHRTAYYPARFVENTIKNGLFVVSSGTAPHPACPAAITQRGIAGTSGLFGRWVSLPRRRYAMAMKLVAVR
jgi:hypothetical protein